MVTFRAESLFHHVENPGTILFNDDTNLKSDSDLCSLFKRAMTNFQNETKHYTLGDRNKELTILIPPRCIFLFTSVGDSGDDQLSDRQYRISLNKTPEGNDDYSRFILNQATEGAEDYPITNEVLTCRRIIELLQNHVFRVKMPFAKGRILFNDPDNRRDSRLYLDFVRAVAVLNYRKRSCEKSDDSEDLVITATIEDAIQARDLFRVTAEGRKYRLTKEERDLWVFIYHYQKSRAEYVEGVPFMEIVRECTEKTDKSTTRNVERLLMGRDGNGGLAAKVPGLTITYTMVLDSTNRKYPNTRIVSCDRAPAMGDYEEFVTILVDKCAHVQNEKVGPLPSFPVETRCKTVESANKSQQIYTSPL